MARTFSVVVRGVVPLGRAGRGAQRAVVRGHGAPAEDALAFVGHDLLKEAAALLAVGRHGGHEDHADAIFARTGQRDALVSAGLLEEIVRHLHEDARPVARVRFRAARPAMAEVQQHGQGLTHDLVGFAALDVDHKPDAASVVFKLRIVQALLDRQPGQGRLALRARFGLSAHCWNF